jgi:hypothetical protein
VLSTVLSQLARQALPGFIGGQLGGLSGATVLPVTAAEGADLHCECLARTLVHERVLDALDDLLRVAD